MARVFLIKSLVQGHPSHTPKGRVIFVRPYVNRAIKHPDDIRQGDLFAPHPELKPTAPARPALVVIRPPPPAADGAPDLASYDHILVGFSGGKDSTASVLDLLERGVPKEKVELWHHDVDGDGRNLMDWPITKAYCKRLAEHLGLKLYFSYREGGIEREMNRHEALNAPVVFETPEGVRRNTPSPTIRTTREQFPQQGSIASGRWCSGKAKIEVMEAAIRNQKRFEGARTLVVTGERGEESTARQNYKIFEPHKVSTEGRHVDAYRNVHGWTEGQVWDVIKQHGIVPHPAYQLGYSRLSCRNCIFADPNQWATTRKLYPESFKPIVEYEQKWNKTIHRTETVEQRADKGTVFAAALAQPALARIADGHTWEGPIAVSPELWTLPAGAFKKGGGPT